ncbi:hypothetical protein NECID01_0767 [Nematocida sp. AWRm77]|nr:hypothetical protein NECID01_0767 [Nematocida sp. AWRm77]
MNYLSWLSKTPDIAELTGLEEYLKKEREESMRVMRKRLRRGKETEKQRAEDLLGEANKLYVKGELAQCVEQIKEALHHHSTSDSAYYLLGVVYEELGKPEQSFTAFLIAASIKKTDKQLWMRLYEKKKEEKDVGYQVYILKKLKKLEVSLELLEELVCIYRAQGSQEKIFETEAEMIPYTGFKVGFITDLLGCISGLKNKGRIIDTISREVFREKSFVRAPDEFLIGYVDILFMEEKYSYIEQVQNTLVYLQRTLECRRTQIILFFSSLVSEAARKCCFCAKQQDLCWCKDTLFLDGSGNILLENGKDSLIINSTLDAALLSDGVHLGLTAHFVDVLIQTKKYSFSLALLKQVDEMAEKTLPIAEPEEEAAFAVQHRVVEDQLYIKQRIAFLYEKGKEYEQSILALKNILSYKERLGRTAQNLFEEVKMKISQIYEKLGNIDLALEYAFQIKVDTHHTEKGKGLQRGKLLFYSRKECMKAKSLLYRAEHIYNSEMTQTATSNANRKYFLTSAQELVSLFLNNRFLFEKKKKKKKDAPTAEGLSQSQLVSTKEFENDYELLQEINGLGEMFCPPEEAASLPRSKQVYFDALASLLHGVSLQSWIDVLKKYLTSLYYEKSYGVCILFLKKLLSSSVLRLCFDHYSFLVWMLVRVSIEAQSFSSLNYAITQMIVFYSHRVPTDSSSFYYMGYFLVGLIPGFAKQKEFYMLQKNLQRNLRRKFFNPSFDKASILTLLSFSYMPSFVYADTIHRIEELVKLADLPRVDISLLGISRAIALASIFLSHASSRKVFDRNYYIEKGIQILKTHIVYLETHFTHTQTPPQVSLSHKQVKYTFAKKSICPYYYTEENHTEKLALLQYNMGRAYHQYKLFGLAETCYVLALAYGDSQETHQLSVVNLSLLNKEVVIGRDSTHTQSTSSTHAQLVDG